MSKKILIVDSDTPELNAKLKARGEAPTGQGYAGALMRIDPDITCDVIAPYAGQDAPDVSVYAGAVFTGSGVDWNTDDERVEPLATIMRRVFDAGVPALGSCNGLQLAASVLGGSSTASPNGREDGLARDVTLTEAGKSHPLLEGRVDGYAVPCVHRDEVTALPNGAVVLASNAHSPVQAMAYEKGNVRFWGMQYHPEFSAEFIAGCLRAYGRGDDGMADDIEAAQTDPAAARRLGIRGGDLDPYTRTLELRNWLNSL